MKKSWFQHLNLTQQEADELISRYAKNNIETRKNLSADYQSWIVSAYLPVTRKRPRVDKSFQWRFWGEA